MTRTVFVVFVTVAIMQCSWSGDGSPRVRSVFGAVFEPPSAVLSQNPVATICMGCSRKYTLSDNNGRRDLSEDDHFTVTEEELTALRIEYIKNQILRKLRLKEKPTVSMPHLPQPVTEDENLVPKQHGKDSHLDDYYGKTTQAIIFPYEDQAKCLKKKRYPSACLPFQLPSDVYSTDLSSAELWFHKEADSQDAHNQTFIITEVAHWDTKKSFQKTTPIAIQQTNITQGWLRVEVSQVIKNWLDYQDSPTHAINVACKTCGRDLSMSPVSFKPSFKPFLVIYTHSQQRKSPSRKPKRHANCTPSLNECCRESLYVSFAEIGWDDWIIQPSGYNAYFCKGSCATAASLTLSGSQHNTILQKVMYGSNRTSSAKLELKPCCAATQFLPLQLFYMDNNKTITSKILSNMVVESCGCM